MPASQPLIASFTASHAGTISDKTLNNWLAGLHFWHLVNGSPWSGADMLCSVHRGLAKMVPPSSRWAKRPPVTIEALTLLVNSLDSSSPLDVAVSAVACIAFWSCCHLEELLPPSAHIFDSSKHVSRSVLPITIKTLLNSSSFMSIHIPWSKTMQEYGADISITTRAHCRPSPCTHSTSDQQLWLALSCSTFLFPLHRRLDFPFQTFFHRLL